MNVKLTFDPIGLVFGIIAIVMLCQARPLLSLLFLALANGGWLSTTWDNAPKWTAVLVASLFMPYLVVVTIATVQVLS